MYAQGPHVYIYYGKKFLGVCICYDSCCSVKVARKKVRRKSPENVRAKVTTKRVAIKMRANCCRSEGEGGLIWGSAGMVWRIIAPWSGTCSAADRARVNAFIHGASKKVTSAPHCQCTVGQSIASLIDLFPGLYLSDFHWGVREFRLATSDYSGHGGCQIGTVE